MKNTEPCLNCTKPYSKCPFNYYHQRFCSASNCQAASRKYSDKKYYEKKYLKGYLTAIRPFPKGEDSRALFLGIRGERVGIKGIEIRVKEYAEKLKLKNISQVPI